MSNDSCSLRRQLASYICVSWPLSIKLPHQLVSPQRSSSPQLPHRFTALSLSIFSIIHLPFSQIAMSNNQATDRQTTVESTLPARYQRLPATSQHTSKRGSFEITSTPGRVGTPPLQKLPIDAPYNLSKHEGDVRWAIIATSGPDLDPFQREILEILRREGVKWPSNWDEVDIEQHAVEGEAVKFPGVFMTGHPTVWIFACWDESDPIYTARCWENAVVSVKNHIDAKLMAQGKNFDVGVYIQADDLMRGWECTVVNEEDLPPKLMNAAWRQVKDAVHLEFFSAEGTTRNITSISLFKRAKYLMRPPGDYMDEYMYAEWSKPPLDDPLTVFITVDYESDEMGWGQITTNLRQHLTAQGFDMDVYIEYNDFDDNGYSSNYRNYPAGFKPASEKANVGAAIGSARYVPGHEAPLLAGPPLDAVPPAVPPPRKHVGPTFGTLGCWLQVRTKSNPTDWLDVALASYHALRPAIDGYICGQAPSLGSPLQEADRAGVKPQLFEHGPNTGVISYPPRMDGFSVKSSAPTSEEDTDWIATNALGRIWYASGYNRRACRGSGGQLDWALILPSNPDKVGLNKALEPGRVSSSSTETLRQPAEGGLRGWDSANEGKRYVRNWGADTGLTIGCLNVARKSDIRIGLPICGSLRSSDLNSEDWQETQEDSGSSRPIWTRYHCEEVIYKSSDRIISPQDAGSMVFDYHRRCTLGMVRPGGSITLQGMDNDPCLPRQHGISCITPIEDIFEDIIRFSDGELLEVKMLDN